MNNIQDILNNIGEKYKDYRKVNAHFNSKKCYVFSLEGTLLYTFPSYEETAKFFNCKSNTIRMSCMRKGGLFRKKFYLSNTSTLKTRQSHNKEVILYKKDGSIEKFRTATEFRNKYHSDYIYGYRKLKKNWLKIIYDNKEIIH